MAVLPGKTLALAAAAGLAACASGHGAAFNAQAMDGQDRQASRDPQRSLQDAGSTGLAGGRGHGGAGYATAGTAGARGHGPLAGGRVSTSRSLYVSGNAPIAGRASVGVRATSSRTPAAGARLSGGGISARGAAAGVTLAAKTDPLGGRPARVRAAGLSASVGGAAGGLVKGKPVLGKKGAATGVASAAGRTAGSLIGSASKGVDAGVGGLTGPLAGGKHKKSGH